MTIHCLSLFLLIFSILHKLFIIICFIFIIIYYFLFLLLLTTMSSILNPRLTVTAPPAVDRLLDSGVSPDLHNDDGLSVLHQVSFHFHIPNNFPSLHVWSFHSRPPNTLPSACMVVPRLLRTVRVLYTSNRVGLYCTCVVFVLGKCENSTGCVKPFY